MVDEVAKEMQSIHIPLIGFKITSEILNYQFIQGKVNSFFADKKIESYEPIETEDMISDVDFKGIEIKYFYQKIFSGIKKVNGKIQHTVKYGITFDKNCQDKVIKLHETPVFYYIYIDLQELFDYLRKNVPSKHNKYPPSH